MNDKCPKCKILLEPGIAILQTWTGKPDFIGDDRIVTMSPGGPGKLSECLKCPECGYSRTINVYGDPRER